MKVADHYINAGNGVRHVLSAVGLLASQYYFTPNGNKSPGRKASSYTTGQQGLEIGNQQVIDEVKSLLEKPFVDYGYLKVTHWLRKEKGYVINPKKVYRLMRENRLLSPKRNVYRGNRAWVKELVPKPEEPFECIEFDIKYVYIHGQRRNAMLLTAIDVYSRLNMAHLMGFSMTQVEVMAMFDYIKDHFRLPENVRVRSDNGSQFTAGLVQKHLKDLGISQEFTLPATPEQNAHIEAYHSIVERAVCRRHEFEDLAQALGIFDQFRQFYNSERIHSAVGFESPMRYLRSHGIELNPKEFFPCGWRLETTADERDFEDGSAKGAKSPLPESYKPSLKPEKEFPFIVEQACA